MINNWRTSSYTQPNDTCVEVGYDDQEPNADQAMWGFGDTKDPLKRRIFFRASAAAQFFDSARTGNWTPA